MTVKEYLNKMIDALEAQGKESYNMEDETCRYRYDGLKCIVGHGLCDEFYNPSFELAGIATPTVLRAFVMSTKESGVKVDGIIENDKVQNESEPLLMLRSVLIMLQVIHDSGDKKAYPTFESKIIAMRKEVSNRYDS